MAKRHGTFAEAAEAKAEAAREEKKAAARAPKPKTIETAEDIARFTSDGELVDIWERRILNPHQRGSGAVRIKTPGQTLRWINLAITGRYNQAMNYDGWRPVHKTELKDEREISGVNYTAEGYVCRGEKQKEWLCKMPAAIWRKIQARKSELIKMQDRKLKESMVSAGATYVGERYGNSAGEQAYEKTKFVGDIKTGVERRTSEEGELFDVNPDGNG